MLLKYAVALGCVIGCHLTLMIDCATERQWFNFWMLAISLFSFLFVLSIVYDFLRLQT
jgi:hypothetical protein